jgi:hypothetical protein
MPGVMERESPEDWVSALAPPPHPANTIDPVRRRLATSLNAASRMPVNTGRIPLISSFIDDCTTKARFKEYKLELEADLD